MTETGRHRFEPGLVIPASVPSSQISPGPRGLSKVQIDHDLAIFTGTTKHNTPTARRGPAPAMPLQPMRKKASNPASSKRPRVEDMPNSGSPASKRKLSPEESLAPNQPPAWAAELLASQSLAEGKRILRKAGYRRADDDTSRPADVKLQTALSSAIVGEKRDAVGAIWWFAPWSDFVAGAKKACTQEANISDGTKAYVFWHLLLPERGGLGAFEYANVVFSENEQNRLTPIASALPELKGR